MQRVRIGKKKMERKETENNAASDTTVLYERKEKGEQAQKEIEHKTERKKLNREQNEEDVAWGNKHFKEYQDRKQRETDQSTRRKEKEVF